MDVRSRAKDGTLIYWCHSLIKFNVYLKCNSLAWWRQWPLGRSWLVPRIWFISVWNFVVASWYVKVYGIDKCFQNKQITNKFSLTVWLWPFTFSQVVNQSLFDVYLLSLLICTSLVWSSAIFYHFPIAPECRLWCCRANLIKEATFSWRKPTTLFDTPVVVVAHVKSNIFCFISARPLFLHTWRDGPPQKQEKKTTDKKINDDGSRWVCWNMTTATKTVIIWGRPHPVKKRPPSSIFLPR